MENDRQATGKPREVVIGGEDGQVVVNGDRAEWLT